MNKIVEKGIEEMRNLYFGEKTYEELDKVKSNINIRMIKNLKKWLLNTFDLFSICFLENLN